mmetsp:Transcript_6486/g.19181  ORF Transcript_6486/g.19181 Transcript_6486/m.19181 type:complete len:207 (-) Transcript_6486:642-1262(-)
MEHRENYERDVDLLQRRLVRGGVHECLRHPVQSHGAYVEAVHGQDAGSLSEGPLLSVREPQHGETVTRTKRDADSRKDNDELDDQCQQVGLPLPGVDLLLLLVRHRECREDGLLEGLKGGPDDDGTEVVDEAVHTLVVRRLKHGHDELLPFAKEMFLYRLEREGGVRGEHRALDVPHPPQGQVPQGHHVPHLPLVQKVRPVANEKS